MTSRQNKARSKKKTTADAAVFAVMRRAKQCRLCAICRQTTVTRALRSARGCNMNRHAEYSWRSHVHRTRLRSACSPSSIEIAMSGVEGEGPSSFLSGVAKGDTLFREREYPPFTHSRTVRESSSCTGAGKKLFYASGVKIPFSVTSIVQRISCSSTGTSGDMSCSRQMSTVGQWSCGSRRS